MDVVDIDSLLNGLIKTYDKPGKGRKQCPECSKYIGARQHNCACGHEFTKADLKTPKPTEKIDENTLSFLSKIGKNISDVVVDVPSGSCFFKLKGRSQEDVTSWCDQVLWRGKSFGKIYTANAMKYFLRESVGINDPGFKQLSLKVDQWRKNL